MASVTVGDSQFVFDYNVEFTIDDFKSLPIGDVVSRTFPLKYETLHNGDKWRLAVKKNDENDRSFYVECDLQLMTTNFTGGAKFKAARITIMSDRQTNLSATVEFRLVGAKKHLGVMHFYAESAMQMNGKIEVIKTAGTEADLSESVEPAQKRVRISQD